MSRQAGAALWIWGRQPVLEALKAGAVNAVLLAPGLRPAPILAEIERAAQRYGVALRTVSTLELERLAPGQNMQGIAAEIKPPDPVHLETVIEAANGTGRPPFLLALDQIQDPHNLGALLRTAGAAGVDGVVLPERGSAGLTGIVAKAAAGALQHVRLVHVPNLARALDLAKARGLWIVGLDAESDQTLYETDLQVPLMLVVGGEEKGLRRLTRERCDHLVGIPILNSFESLNASVAGAVAMYEVVRQRHVSAS